MGAGPLRLVVVLTPGADVGACIAVAQRAEAAGFDALLLQDAAGARLTLEPTALMAALGALTRRIGLIACMTTAHHQPYTVARRIVAIDHVAQGRAGWLALSAQTAAQARHFPSSVVEGGARDARMAEFVAVVDGLWDGWEEGGLVRDKATGIYMDRDRVHILDHDGPYFRVRGPLNVTRSVQGKPVLALRGVSEPMRALAVRRGDLLFAGALDRAAARSVREDVAARLAGQGRPRSAVAMLPDLPERCDAETMLAWQAEGVADGFTVPAERLDAFCRDVLPALPRPVPEGSTLRARLGLPVPINPYTARRSA